MTAISSNINQTLQGVTGMGGSIGTVGVCTTPGYTPMYDNGCNSTQLYIGNTQYIPKKKRAPYKKDKYNLVIQTDGVPEVLAVTVGKVKTLAQIGKMLSVMKPDDILPLRIHRAP